ncbi:MAG: hypothetical protein C0621_00005, partial [Desulfuromonas sp.]
LDFSSKRPRRVERPDERSFLLNYQLSLDHDSRRARDEFSLATDLAWRRGPLLFSSEQRYADTAEGARLTRLMSRGIWDWRSQMRQLIVGDALSHPGPLERSVRFAGVTLRRDFALKNDFIQYPTLDLSGAVSSPSTLDIYLNGVRLRSEELPPGEFQLDNLSRTLGYGHYELVLRDPYGVETRIENPFYLSDQLLQPKLHEYSYSLGAVREDYGTDDDRYSDPLFVGHHRYGVDRRLTLGGSLQLSNGYALAAGQLAWQLRERGIVTLALAGTGGDGSGEAALLRWSYLRRPLNGYVELRQHSQGFLLLGESAALHDALLQVTAGGGFAAGPFGSLSFDASHSDNASLGQRSSIGGNYSLRLKQGLSLNLLARSVQEESGNSWYTYLTLTWALDGERQVSSRLELQSEGERMVLQTQKSLPVGQGYGYWASTGYDAVGSNDGVFFAPSGQYNGRYTNWRADVRIEQTDSGSENWVQLSSLGAISQVGEVWSLSRPVPDSFSLVQVGGLEGVRVRQNGQEMGRTDARGLLLLPNLNGYYDNLIAIDPRDIPFTHALGEAEHYISPSARGGSCLVYPLTRSTPVTGRLHLKMADGEKPLEFHELVIEDEAGRKMRIPTGRGGEFYLDPAEFPVPDGSMDVTDCNALVGKGDSVASSQRVVGWLDEVSASPDFVLTISKSDEPFVDLGTILIDSAGKGDEDER